MDGEKLGMIPLEFSRPFPAPPGSGRENPRRSQGFPPLIPAGNSKEKKEEPGKIPLGARRRQQGADPGTIPGGNEAGKGLKNRDKRGWMCLGESLETQKCGKRGNLGNLGKGREKGEKEAGKEEGNSRQILNSQIPNSQILNSQIPNSRQITTAPRAHPALAFPGTSRSNRNSGIPSFSCHSSPSEFPIPPAPSLRTLSRVPFPRKSRDLWAARVPFPVPKNSRAFNGAVTEPPELRDGWIREQPGSAGTRSGWNEWE
ncbi:hypothetical protein DUI87_33347 [Hirundo rustica rustica]|uniref:Uncharacterized protein n=1 Tax=Hirundo rustica rustica TaxID=333673 RepID=A0A3M0ILF2_HIRRU|nr:hypothetical protein DUI87_33347 [Hirundo rustica rustica]